ncbi:MAG: cupin domain-containing protein [Candidatus Bathyarchaeia archaeon]|jgi:mannose-6-phosphate isomerase-like protein (cupin superfamily)
MQITYTALVKRNCCDRDMEPRKIKKTDAKDFMEGDEDCRLYYKTNQLVFGTSTLQPGKKGTIDPGHKYGWEIYYAAKGRVICRFPKISKQVELDEGDTVAIPPGEPHELTNNGTIEAIVVWSLAPPD